MTIKTSQACGECRHGPCRPPTHLANFLCEKGHKPRFYLPRGPDLEPWGWRRKCGDFEILLQPEGNQAT